MSHSQVPWRHGAAVCAALACCAAGSGAEAQPATAPAPAAAAAPDAEPRFDILEYVIEGNAVLPVQTVEQAVTPFLGPALTMTRVEAARAALEKAYQDAGYLSVFVDVPEQRVDGGVVLLNVIEGRIERLRVTGSRYFSQGTIRDQVPELAEGRVPNFNVVQQQLARVNRTEDRRVQPLLRPGKTPGTVESELKVTDRLPLGASLEVNNRHAAGTDPLRLSLTAHYDNLWQRDHSLAVTAITAPQSPKQSRVLTGTYSVPLDDGAALVGYALASDSAVEPLGATTVFGKGTTFGLRFVQPLPGITSTPAADVSANELTHSATFGVDYKEVRQRVVASDDELSTPLRYLPFSLAYNATLPLGDSVTSLNATGVFAIGRLLQRTVECGGYTLDQFECTRHGADGSFSTLRLDLRHDRPLGASGWRLGGRLAGLWSTQPLVSGEQFVAGGADTVRGYLEAEAAGDRGLLGSIELFTPNLAGAWGRLLSSDDATAGAPTASRYQLTDLTGLAFVDAARTTLDQPLPGQAPRTALLGTGLGLRLRAGRALTARLDLALPLKATATTVAHDLRVHVSVGLQY